MSRDDRNRRHRYHRYKDRKQQKKPVFQNIDIPLKKKSREEYEQIFKLMNVEISDLLSNEICPLCSLPIEDYYSTIYYKQHDKRVHLECVIKEISARESLRPDENICYMGGGSFAICSYQDLRGRYRFFIRKRIQFEDRSKNLQKLLEDDDTPHS